MRAGQIEGLKFRRQHSIGPYIVDFVCPSRRLVIEVDGGLHRETVEADELRTRFLESQAYRVIRFWNHEVMGNMDGVLRAIVEALRQQAGDCGGPSP